MKQSKGVAKLRVFVVSLALLLFAVAALPLGAFADDVFVDLRVNGDLLSKAGLVHGDRTYVRLNDVAEVLGGRYIYDRDLKVGFILTGRYLNLVVDKLAQINPELDGYSPLSPFEPGMGLHYGLPGPHVTVGLTPTGLVAGFELLFPADRVTHQPWFDQQPGHPEEFHGVGQAYTEHLYVVDPRLIHLGGTTQVAMNGAGLDIDASAFLWYEDELYVRMRDLAQAAGGGVGWDRSARIASARIPAGADLSLGVIRSLNRRVMHFYDQISPYVPKIGYRYGTDGPGLIFALDGHDLLTVVAGLFPDGDGPWFPWFDQRNGQPGDFPGFGKAYSQHLRMIEPTKIEY